MSRILVIEDEEHIAKGIQLNLEMKGHEVVVVDRGDKGLQTWRDESFDLLVLDLMLPGLPGEKVLEEVRALDERFPVMILSAKDEMKSKINCFGLGTDDYLAKPFNLDEFLLRVERHLMRSSWVPKNITKKYSFGENWVELGEFKAFGVSGEFQITEQEAILLEHFFVNEGHAIKRSDLLKLLGYSEESSTRTIDNFLVRFRKYFEKNPKDPQFFVSMRSVGYLFKK